MKQTKAPYFLSLFVVLGIFLISGCGGSSTGGVTLPVTLVSLALTPTNPSLPLGLARQFSATGTYSDGTTGDLSSTVTWVSSNSGVATVGSSGLAASVAIGTTTITASSGAVSGSATLTVTPAALVSIAVSPANPGTTMGVATQLAATGSYTDHTTSDITASVAWFSADTSTALVGNGSGASGQVTPWSAGTVALSAHLNGITGSANFTVAAAPVGGGNPVVTTTHTTTTSTTAQTLTVSAGTPTLVEDRTYYDSSVAIAVPPAHGTASVTGQVVTYTPAPGFTGTDTLIIQEVTLSGSIAVIQVGDVVLGHNVNVNTNTNADTVTITVGPALARSHAGLER